MQRAGVKKSVRSCHCLYIDSIFTWIVTRPCGGTVENEERWDLLYIGHLIKLLTPLSPDTRKLYGVVKSDRKRPLQEVTNIFNEYRARPVSDRTVQRKLYETQYHKCVVKISIRFRDYNVKNRWHGVN